MRALVLVVGALAAFAALLVPKVAAASSARSPAAPGGSMLDDLYQRYGEKFGVDWRLIKAIALHESDENPLAVNHADNESIGLMQVLCRPDGRGGCLNRLNVEGWSETTREKLFDPEWNVYIGAQILADNIRAYGVAKGIAVYNAWDQHTAPTLGPFKNQGYVNEVLSRARALGYGG